MRQASPPGGIWGGPGLQTRPEAVATAVAGTGCVGSRQKHSNKYMTLQEEITRRRTFAVIAHPDAGKTTLTEKLLLFGGAIHVAGAVKSNKIKKGATSDFMEIERQRGISVATAVMGFEYKGTKINILDTPGHEDFAEDTYRTLTAVDSVIIVIDGAKGVESQTRKLMEVCRMRSTPVIVFINKLDRPSKEPFDLLDEVEKELRIRVRPLAFPISNGPTFRGVYNLYEKNLSLFTSDEKLTADAQTAEISDLASQSWTATSARNSPNSCARTSSWSKVSTTSSTARPTCAASWPPCSSARRSTTSACANCSNASSASPPRRARRPPRPAPWSPPSRR